MADEANVAGTQGVSSGGNNEALQRELQNVTSTQRAAVLMLLLGEEQAADIIRFLNPKEVQALGMAMVQVAELSQEAVNAVLDEFVATIKRQTSLGLGTADYVEKVFKRALGMTRRLLFWGVSTPGTAVRVLIYWLGWMPGLSPT